MVEIERATVQDVPAIKAILRETWHDTYGSLLPKTALDTITSQWHAPELLSEQVQTPDIYFAVAREAGVAVGVITAHEQEGVIVVNRLYVRPHYQRRGIGRQLLEAGYRTFGAAHTVRLSVEAENRKGVAFYAKHGFRETARSSEDVAGARLEYVVMEKACKARVDR
jgi:ribosomal protein S18 acetylase RimI-like enzyme